MTGQVMKVDTGKLVIEHESGGKRIESTFVLTSGTKWAFKEPKIGTKVMVEYKVADHRNTATAVVLADDKKTPPEPRKQ